MKIYVASSWRNSLQDEVVIQLRAAGHEVYDFKNPPEGTGFDWAEVDPNWQTWTARQFAEALNHPISMKGYNSDFNAMKWADACVIVLPCNRSAHSEAGWFSGQGKPVIVLTNDNEEPELMYNMFDAVTDSFPGVLTALKHFDQRGPSALAMVNREVSDQRGKHGRTVNHDINVNSRGQLMDAAIKLSTFNNVNHRRPYRWDLAIWKKMLNKQYCQRLAIAASLIIAEIQKTKVISERNASRQTEDHVF